MGVQTPEIAAGTGEHVVQFYERDSDLSEAVGGYLAQAVRAGDASIVIATPEHRAAFREELAAVGIDLAEVDRDGTIRWFDAAELLAKFMPDGRIDPQAFDAVVGAVIHGADRSTRELRAYGEMVALLWDAGDVLAAIELEKLWNDLARELRFSLWCAYHAHSLEIHEHADELHEVCHLHTSVFDEATARFGARVDAPLAARRFVSSVLARRPYQGRVSPADAQLVISELATNAVIHAGTPFSVTISCNGAAVRFSVRDESAEEPVMRHSEPNALSGRGLALVDTIAGGWGIDHDSDGKTVWAELPLC